MSIFELERIKAETQLQHLEFHKTLESTNVLAAQLVPELLLHQPALILTENQTAGRGRGSHQWHSASGALTFSLAQNVTHLSAHHRCLISLAAGLGIQQALQSCLRTDHTTALENQHKIQIKWPNDLLIDGRKVCGILTELHSDSDQALVVIGVGVNVNNSHASLPSEIHRHATSLYDFTGVTFDLTGLLIAIVNSIQATVLKLPQARDQVIDELNRVHFLTGKTLQVETGSATIKGVCEAIDSDGCLIVRSETKTHRVIAGSILNWS